MSLLETYGKEIFAVVVAAIPWLLERFKGKARLQYSQSHNHTFLVQQPLFNLEGERMQDSQTASTQSFIVYNAGRETATKVEIVFNWEPIYNVLPLRHHSQHTHADKRYSIIFDSLSPKENVSIHILSVNRELPRLLTVRSDQSVGEYVNTQPTVVISRLKLRLFFAAFYVGVFTCAYLLLLLLETLGLIPSVS